MATPPFRWQAVHVLALSALAVAQPIFDLLARDSEFLVAHRAGAPDLVGLVAVLTFLVPLAALVPAWVAGRFSRRLQTAIVVGALFTLVGLLALQVVKRAGVDGAWPAFGGALVVAALATWVYARVRAAQAFASVLGVAALVVPAVFLFSDPIVKFWRPADRLELPPPLPDPSVPIVMVVFDQFPLVSLVDERGEIDGRLYPSFAALARESTWFRTATAVSDRTGHALPALLSGRYPEPDRLPRTDDHPANLFTWLAGYQMHVAEPLTDLCPPSLCGRSWESAAARLGAMLGDLTAVYLHVIAPAALAASLPAVNQTWRGFGRPTWLQRWRDGRSSDRRAAFLRFVEGIDAGSDRPVLHFGHFLLPHEPYLYYPSGRAFADAGDPLIALQPGVERWIDDRWAVATSYQLHLQQVRMVDGLLGRLVARLKQIGLYDRALLVVTSDHGASFRPGDSFRTPTRTNYADIMAVPLFVKAPGQQTGLADDGFVEAVDVLPTVADLLGATLPWTTSGRSAFGESRPDRRRLFFNGAKNRRVYSTRQVRRGARQALRLKLELFGSPVDPDRISGPGPASRALGRPVTDFPRAGGPADHVSLDLRSRQVSVGADVDFAPGLISGFTQLSRTESSLPVVAVAVDGTIRAVARPIPLPGRRTARWQVLLPERLVRAGARRIEIFEIAERRDGAIALRATGVVAREEGAVNLLSSTIQQQLGIEASGIHGEEHMGTTPFRWTSGEARLVVPVDPADPPRTLGIGIVQGGPPQRTLEITVNGCALYHGPAPVSPIERRFSLDSCPIDGAAATIEITVEPFVPGSHDPRPLGVALEHVTLESK